MEVLAQLLSSSLSGCGRKLVGFALKVQVSGDLWSPAVASKRQPFATRHDTQNEIIHTLNKALNSEAY